MTAAYVAPYFVVRKAAPIPPVRGRTDALFAEPWRTLKVGDSYELPDAVATAFAAYVKKIKGQCTVRRLSPTTKGVWRTA